MPDFFNNFRTLCIPSRLTFLATPLLDFVHITLQFILQYFCFFVQLEDSKEVVGDGKNLDETHMIPLESVSSRDDVEEKKNFADETYEQEEHIDQETAPLTAGTS